MQNPPVKLGDLTLSNDFETIDGETTQYTDRTQFFGFGEIELNHRTKKKYYLKIKNQDNSIKYVVYGHIYLSTKSDTYYEVMIVDNYTIESIKGGILIDEYNNNSYGVESKNKDHVLYELNPRAGGNKTQKTRKNKNKKCTQKRKNKRKSSKQKK
jgi:hypothetical protein